MKVVGLLALLAIVVLGIALGLDASGLVFQADRTLANPTLSTQEWIPLINLRNNAFLFWRYDIVLLTLSRWLPLRAEVAYALSALLVFSLGNFLLLLRLSAHRAPHAALVLTVLTSTALLGVFGWDSVLFASVAWIPLLTLCLIALLHGREALGIFIAASCYFSFRLMHSANILAPLFGLYALTAAGFFFRELRPSGRSVLSGALALSAVIIFGFASQPFQTVPNMNSQGYPYFAHVVRDDDVGEKLHPLIGPSSRIPYIDRDAVREYSGPISIALGLLALYLLRAARLYGNRAGQIASQAAFGLTALSCIDLFLPPNLSAIAPLAALSRLVPGAAAYPASEAALVLAIVCIGIAAACSRAALVPGAMFFCLAILPSAVLAPQMPRLHFDFSLYTADEQQFAVSPSLPVLHTLGPWILRERSRIERTNFAPSNAFPVEVVASHNKPGNEVGLMFDLNRNTRWSPGRALQDGTEWLYLKFTTAQKLSGIELAGGAYKSDFPRALRISTLSDCPSGSVDIVQLHNLASELIHYQPWDGAVAFTPAGFPYYTAQTRVQAFFPRSVEVHCLLLEQTGKVGNLDWSVSELRLGIEGDTPVPPSDDPT